MYFIDFTHYLDAKGVIAAQGGPARRLAEFVAAVVAHASDFDRDDAVPGPLCFKCRARERQPVETGLTDNDIAVWLCATCGTAGEISNWRHSFWDLSQGLPSS